MTPGGDGRLPITTHAALLLVDVQRGFVTPAIADVPARIADFLDREAERFDLVVASRFVNAADSPCRRLLAFDGVQGPPETDLCPGIEREGVLVLDKHTYALGERFGALLAEHRIEQLLVAGLDTHACVMHEALDAFDRSIRPIVVDELCGSGDGAEAHRAALLVLRQSIGVQNVLGIDGRPLEL